MGILVFGSGDRAFTDRGILGAGVPGYARAQGYMPSMVPTAVGARYFFPDPEYDEDTDQAKPAAVGNKWDGGKPAYQMRVHKAAEAVGKDQGLTGKQIKELDPLTQNGTPKRIGGGSGGGNLMGPGFLPAPGFERPDYTIFNFPDASLVDDATEEIELDQALSLAGRFGRDFLGYQLSGVITELVQEHLTVQGADHEQTLSFRLNTRTGGFSLNDPELISQFDVSSVSTAGATDTATVNLTPIMGALEIAEPYLYVAPRLFWRFTNAGDQTMAISDFSIRMASIQRQLNFRLFIELLERFADVTLL